MNVWHDISAGDQPTEVFTAVIEIPWKSQNKYELDKDTGLIRLDRVLNGSMIYPADYGMVPKTLAEDGDPLDVIILTTNPLPVSCLVDCRPIGVLRMVDDGEPDDKIIAVPVEDPRWFDVHSLDDVSVGRKAEIQEFFMSYKFLEKKSDKWAADAEQKISSSESADKDPTNYAKKGHKTVEVPGYYSKEVAQQIIRDCLELYEQKYS